MIYRLVTIPPRQRLASRFLASVRHSSSATSVDAPVQLPLAELHETVLGYPNSSSSTTTRPIDFTIQPASSGGHALIGANATGKSLISNTLASQGSAEYLRAGNFYTDKPWYSTTVAHVSFESHEEILEKGGSVTKAISRGGQLSKAAQFLIVRFGLFPLLHRNVGTLSTGEIRKVMLVRALAERPRLLILDNAFDGLDVPSREKLKELVSRTIQGFRPDILVQAVSARDTAHTQVLLLTHRPEEIVDEIEHISVLNPIEGEIFGELDSFVRDSMSSEQLFEKTLGVGSGEQYNGIAVEPWNDNEMLPSLDDIQSVWKGPKSEMIDKPLVVAQGLNVQRGEATLLHDLNWQVKAGERWLVAGGNGAGKSTLSRLLAKSEGGFKNGSLTIDTVAEATLMDEEDNIRPGVGWVSTERHMKTSKSQQTTCDILFSNGSTPKEVGLEVAKWLDLDKSILDQPFYQLSQGQQKMVLLASAIASRPSILVLDEPCQGLDLLARRRLLGLVERMCQATNVSLIYITHHLEELIPSVTHVIHLAGGKDVYQGTRQDYDPSAMPVPAGDAAGNLTQQEYME